MSRDMKESKNFSQIESLPENSLEFDLLQNAYKFSFEMAAYILEHGKPVSFGKHINVTQAPFRTFSINAFHLRGTEIEKIETIDGVRTIFVERLALSGLNAPLPTPYGELIFRRTHEQDDAMASFVNVFNSRILGISYQVSKRLHINLQDHGGDNCLFMRNLAALCGEDLRKMNRRFSRVSMLFWNKEKSAAGLESLLKALFGFEVKVLQFCTTWTNVGEDNRLLSGKKRLGINMGLGTRAAVSNLGVHIELQQEFDKVCELLNSKEEISVVEGEGGESGEKEKLRKEGENGDLKNILSQVRFVIQKYIGDFYIYKLKVRPYSALPMRIGSKIEEGGEGGKRAAIAAVLGRTAWMVSGSSEKREGLDSASIFVR